MNRKYGGFALVYVILALALVLLVGYFVMQKNGLGEVGTSEKKLFSQSPSPLATSAPSNSEDMPGDWVTYKSQKYSFEFKYPPEVRLSDQSEGYVAVSYMGEKQKASGRTQTELFDGYFFNVADVTGSGYKDLDDFLAQKLEQLKDMCTTIGDPRETTISGRRAITHRLSCLGDYDAYYVQDGEKFWEIGMLYVGDEEDISAYEQMVKQIFGTFKFGD